MEQLTLFPNLDSHKVEKKIKKEHSASESKPEPKASNDITEAEMYRNHLPLVHFVIQRYGFASLTHIDPMLDYDDLVQEGGIALLRAVRKYDPARSTAFSTFAVKVIVNQFLKLVYNQNLQKNQRPPTLSLSDTIGDEDDALTLEELIGSDDLGIEGIAAKDLWQKLSANLPQRELEIFTSRVVEGEPFTAIGKRHKISNERASQLYDITRKRLRKRLKRFV